MRLFVRTLEEETPDWWGPDVATAWDEESRNFQEQQQAGPPENGDNQTSSPRGPSNHTAPMKSRSVAEVVVEGSWVSPYIASDRRPPPRYEQAMALVGNLLYIIGGNCGGRYLADTWALNLENLSWTCISSGKVAAASVDVDGTALLDPPALAPLAGHAAVAWNGNVVSIGGHTKAKNATLELPLRLLDTQAGSWSTLTAGLSPGVNPLPGPRGGHSATIIGSKVYVFGGEDARRKPLSELWTLDLSTLEWHRPETTGPAPAPRSAHAACAYRNRYIVMFGGGSVAICYDDLVVLDTQTMEWSRPATKGPVPPPRAGHASAILGSIFYVVGGGNNSRGCADMYALDLSELGTGALTWTLVGNTPPESAIAAEGLSLVTVPMAGCMVSFGGYNGKYHNAVHVYRPEGFVVVKPGSTGAAATAAGHAHGQPASMTASAPAQRRETVDASTGHQNAGSAGPEAARRETNAAAKEAVALEVSIMRRQLDSATAALAAAERAAEEAREALAAEQQRAVALEVEVAELRQQLVAAAEAERELARYRQRAAEESERKPGIWGFITGADSAIATQAK